MQLKNKQTNATITIYDGVYYKGIGKIRSSNLDEFPEKLRGGGWGRGHFRSQSNFEYFFVFWMASLVINFVILHDISSYLVMQLKIIATERPFVWEGGWTAIWQNTGLTCIFLTGSSLRPSIFIRIVRTSVFQNQYWKRKEGCAWDWL